MLTVAVRWITSACTRGGGIVWDDGCVTRAARVMRVVRRNFLARLSTTAPE